MGSYETDYTAEVLRNMPNPGDIASPENNEYFDKVYTEWCNMLASWDAVLWED